MTVHRPNQMVSVDAYVDDAAQTARWKHSGLTVAQSTQVARGALATVLPQIVRDLASDIDLSDAYPADEQAYTRAQDAAEAWLHGLADEQEAQR